MKMNYTKVITLLVCLNATTLLLAQQEEQLSTYFFNPLVMNPAYAGSQKSLMINATVRDQWTNFKGAPKTQVLTLHAPLKKDNFGIGFTFVNDKIGAHSNKSLALDVSYNVRLNKKNHRLAFGIKPTVDIYQTNFSNAKVQDNTDGVFIDNYNYSKVLPNIGAGMYYYGEKFYIGLSSPKIIKNEVNLQSGQKALQENHFYFFGGTVFKLNSMVDMRPSLIVKYVKNAPLSIDVNLSFFILNKVWIGAMYRYNSAVGLNAMYYLTEQLNIGYAYDYGLNAIQKYSVGSHEIMLSYKFKSKGKGYISPRYF